MTITINTDLIDSWTSFHQVFKTTFGFPDFYGANMNAWIDCMTDIDDPTTGMTRINIKPNETLIINLVNSNNFRNNHKEIYYGLLDCAAFVNSRKIAENSKTAIAISIL
jgi:RNAse (barnase) inhibitor barstar